MSKSVLNNFLNYVLSLGLLALYPFTAFAGVSVTSPTNGATLSGPVSYIASATTTSCSKGVASMGIYTAPGVLAYVVNGTHLNTSLNLTSGSYKTVVEEWDYCGGAATTPINITVSTQAGFTSPRPQITARWERQ